MARASEFFIHTLKENPAEAEILSHRLMLRAGLVQQLALGIYTWLPMGVRALRKIEAIVREEMQAAGCHELLMPGVQPASLWQESGRWDDYGKELLRFRDRQQREYCLGPTHEEVITTLVKSRIQSYVDLPLRLFQIQTKFRDEIRPRFGVMRAREFIMKDAYSFDVTERELQHSYKLMEQAYHKIFTRIGFDYRAVSADSGSIGGDVSREFQVITPSGEDLLVISDASDYAANIESAACPPAPFTPPATAEPGSFATPGCTSIARLARFAECEPDECLKLLVVHHAQSTPKTPRLLALALRGDDQLNHIKAEKLPEVATPLRMADAKELQALGLHAGYIGPIDLPFEIIADHATLGMADFVCGSNRPNTHLRGVNWGRDFICVRSEDIRNIRSGEPCADGKGKVIIKRGCEVGHIFQLGTKYSQAMGLKVIGKLGETIIPTMGCYGIGISRIVAAQIEQQHDERGIIWNKSIAPFFVHILPLSEDKQVSEAAADLLSELEQSGIDCLLDDRKLRPGVMFSQADLLGLPMQIIVSQRNLAKGMVEFKHRATGDTHLINRKEALAFVLAQSNAA